MEVEINENQETCQNKYTFKSITNIFKAFTYHKTRK